MTINEIIELFEKSDNNDWLKQDINNNRFINLDLFIKYIKEHYDNRLDGLLNILEDYYNSWEN